MTAKRRERRTRTPAIPLAPTHALPEAKGAVPPLPVWRWRTFPVYFAFAGGAFLGVYAGYLGGLVQGEAGNATPAYVAFIGSALLLGFGLSRVTSRFMVARNWVKPRPQRRR